MKLEQALLILIMLVVVVLGFVGIVWIAYGVPGNACPSGSIYKSGVCCQDFNNDGRCDVVTQTMTMPTGMTVQIETGPSDEEVMIAKLQAAVEALEQKNVQQTRPGYQCDDYGCRRMSSYYGYDDYYGYDYYGYDYGFFDRDRYDDDEWDLTITIKDNDNGDRIEDAYVRIENGDDHSKYTDEDGEVKFRNIEEDCYDIEVEKSGYRNEDDYTCIHRDRKITIYLAPRD